MISDTIPGDRSSYPGGKSGAGIFQRLINLIPPHRVLIIPFAGHCGVVRNIRPAEHTIVIDQNPAVCEWWSNWSRTKRGRALEIHNCDGIEWLRFSLGCTQYSDAKSCGGRSSVTGSRFPLPGCDEESGVTGCRSSQRLVMDDFRDRISQNYASMVTAAQLGGARVTLEMVAAAGDAQSGDGRPTQETMAEAFIFCDPPYVLSERSGGRIYECELTDEDHQRFLGTVTRLDASRYRTMVCGYGCDLYSALDPWFSIDHRVPTRGGLQDERIWMNYPKPVELHDYQYIGDGRRSRERIRRRQKNWREQLMQMPEQERLAMLEVLNATSTAGTNSPRPASAQYSHHGVSTSFT